jgi:hypothetical protein
MSEPAAPMAAAIEERLPSDERRASTRLRSGSSAVCQPAVGQSTIFWQAQVRDISSLGVGLMLRHKVEPGMLVTINLENLAQRVVRTVLARVIFATAQPDGSWHVGCAFTFELSDEELGAFQAERRRPVGPDCRAWVRFPCNIETVCYSMDTSPGEQVPARILNISPGGVGLLAPCEFAASTILHLGLPGGPDKPARKVLVRVVQAREQGNGDWFLGCEFADTLADSELERLL